MAAGGPGDHRLTDVINYNTPVYGREADDLPKALASLIHVVSYAMGRKTPQPGRY